MGAAIVPTLVVLKAGLDDGVLVWRRKSLMVRLDGDAFVSVRSRSSRRGRGIRVR
jgi:hypothetical protein